MNRYFNWREFWFTNLKFLFLSCLVPALFLQQTFALINSLHRRLHYFEYVEQHHGVKGGLAIWRLESGVNAVLLIRKYFRLADENRLLDKPSISRWFMKHQMKCV